VFFTFSSLTYFLYSFFQHVNTHNKIEKCNTLPVKPIYKCIYFQRLSQKQMSIRFCISVVLLASAFIFSVHSQSAVKEYVIRKDFFAGLKAGEFSVYDKNEKQVYYRIESKPSLMQNIELYAYTSKHVVGRL
jgi:hypothetical protein